MEQIKDIMGLDTIHWLLAYGGLAVHILMKLAEFEGKLSDISRREVLTTAASIIAIPIILIVCTDSSVKEILPINYVTAFLTGYQTQSLIRSISVISKKSKD